MRSSPVCVCVLVPLFMRTPAYQARMHPHRLIYLSLITYLEDLSANKFMF